MKIDGKVHCFFEQSGTFKNEFIKLGIPAEDYDIQNNFGQTDHVVDLFKAIEDAYDVRPSLFDDIRGGDLIMAFFPCIFFCESNTINFRLDAHNYRTMTARQASEKIMERSQNRDYFFRLATKLVCVAKERGLRLIIENPYSSQSYICNNFIITPTVIDKDRTLRGDYFVKPTAYWFVNCTNTIGMSLQKDKEKRIIRKSKSAPTGGLCSEDRSMISPDYARNFICDFILGIEQQHTLRTLF
ncbi:MAG: hypothetical protein IIW89_05780 [Alistipes sp.]|nr:hypothetical protein [Alistipes sp.]